MPKFLIKQADFRVAAPQLAGRADLVIVDPPYNQGVAYDSHDDSLTENDFYEWLIGLADACGLLLRDGGTVAAVMSERHQAGLYSAFESYDQFRFRQSVVWHYTFGQSQRKKFTPAWAMIHVFGKGKGPFAFDADAVKVPSARQLKYKDRRAKAGGKVMDNLWTISRVCGTFKEKVDYPNQLPLELTDRLVRAYSRPGDTVIDPCCGSGTAGVSAVRLGRKFYGCDLSARAVAVATARLAAATCPGS